MLIINHFITLCFSLEFLQSEFVDGGTKTHFEALNSPATLHAFKTGLRKQPIIYSLTFNGEEIPEARE